MTLTIPKRIWAAVAVLCLAAGLIVLFMPSIGAALPQYAAATGQPCATCHVNPAGGGPRNAKGQAFEAIPTHATDPAGAFAQLNAPAPAVPAPVAPVVAPAAAGQVTVVLSGAATDDSVVYSIVIRNAGDKISNVFLAGSIPSGATFTAATNTPAGSSSTGADAGVAAWLIGSVPAKGAAGPFVYKVAKGSAQDFGANAFVHWAAPSDGTAVSPRSQPISNAERLAIDQAINDKFNNVDNTLTLWSMQPGTGPRMADLARHFNQTWFAAQNGNWAMADFEVGDQVPGTVNRIKIRNPRLAAALDFWTKDSIEPLDSAIDSKDLTKFNAAYDHAIAGCNSCHAGDPEVKTIKIIRPTAPELTNIDFKGPQ